MSTHVVEVAMPIGGKVLGVLSDDDDVIAFANEWLQSRKATMYLPMFLTVYYVEDGEIVPNHAKTLVYPVAHGPKPHVIEQCINRVEVEAL